jgi:hypothetical protein
VTSTSLSTPAILDGKSMYKVFLQFSVVILKTFLQ